ncbi:DUF4309 domain-containing protein [Cohnella mopanensis]|uniref:DUF4309 domain-containing protein n=1 Tax=Cohnella mopanensis TaxID=2911966 RepID=UPI001EF771EC|nr:DUF4309 domain-containing protein [Cohnella mopanensis]
MYKKVRYILLGIGLLALLLSGCGRELTTQEKLDKAKEYASEQKVDKALKLANEVVVEDATNADGYVVLSELYKLQQQPEKAEQVLELGLESTNAGNIFLAPLKDAYLKKFEASRWHGGKELVDSVIADVDGDKKPEIIILQGNPTSLGENGEYENIDLFVFNPRTKTIVYERGDSDIMTGLPSKLIVGDFTGDGIADVKAAVGLGGSAGGSFDTLISYQQGQLVNLFNQETVLFDIATTVASGDRLLISSDLLEQYLYIDLTAEQKAQESRSIGWKSFVRVAVRTSDDTYALKESFTVFGPLHYSDFIAEVEVNYAFKSGKFVPMQLNVNSMNGQAVIKGEKPKMLVLDEEFPKQIIKGNIPGLNVSLGMKKTEVSSILGKQTGNFYYEGGDFYQFEQATDIAFCFSAAIESEDSLFSLLIYQDHLQNLTFKDVVKAMGEPESQGVDEMLGEYYYDYHYGDTGVYFYASNESSNLSSMTILRK